VTTIEASFAGVAGMSKWEEFSKRLDEYYRLRGRKEFGENLSSMSDDELYEAWEKALGLRQREEFREAWSSLDILLELLNRLIALRDNT
jgi:hypothetical protein